QSVLRPTHEFAAFAGLVAFGRRRAGPRGILPRLLTARLFCRLWRQNRPHRIGQRGDRVTNREFFAGPGPRFCRRLASGVGFTSGASLAPCGRSAASTFDLLLALEGKRLVAEGFRVKFISVIHCWPHISEGCSLAAISHCAEDE